MTFKDSSAHYQILDVRLLDPDANHARQNSSEETIKALVNSIQKVGIIHPIVVRPANSDGRYTVVVGERRRGDAEPHYLPQLRKDILEVICKYVQIDPEMVSVQLEQRDGDISILELNVTLPETEESKP